MSKKQQIIRDKAALLQKQLTDAMLQQVREQKIKKVVEDQLHTIQNAWKERYYQKNDFDDMSLNRATTDPIPYSFGSNKNYTNKKAFVTPEVFEKFVADLDELGKTITNMPPAHTQILIQIRAKFGLEYDKFIGFIDSIIENPDGCDQSILDCANTTRTIYSMLDDLKNRGYVHVFDAFESDLAHAAIRVGVNRYMDEHPEFDFDDIDKALHISQGNKAQFEKYLNELNEQRRLNEEQRRKEGQDLDANGNIIYY